LHPRCRQRESETSINERSSGQISKPAVGSLTDVHSQNRAAIVKRDPRSNAHVASAVCCRQAHSDPAGPRPQSRQEVFRRTFDLIATPGMGLTDLPHATCGSPLCHRDAATLSTPGPLRNVPLEKQRQQEGRLKLTVIKKSKTCGQRAAEPLNSIWIVTLIDIHNPEYQSDGVRLTSDELCNQTCVAQLLRNN